jgi:acetylornithine deacetylase/succinyl-diaminopimelate desuccinylase-like protein
MKKNSDFSSDSFFEEALNHLRALIRINTSNPPGNEIEAVRYIASVLDEEKIEYEIVEPEKGRGNIIARLKSSSDKKGLMLSSHLDVVPTENAGWTHDPFGAEIENGFVWGRGALDMKNAVACYLMAAIAVKRSGKKISRDLIFAAVADEEAGCGMGSAFLAKNKKHMIDAEYAINEVGGFTIHAGNKRIYPVQVASKGFAWIALTAKGEEGHGSVPDSRAAIPVLVEVLNKMKETELPFRVTDSSRTFINTVASAMGMPSSMVLKGLEIPYISEFITQNVIPDRHRARTFHAMLHNTMTPTILKAGIKTNVIPSTAQAVLDVRILPGFSVREIVGKIRNIAGKNIDIEVIKSAEPVEAGWNTDFYREIADVLEKKDPGSIVTPYPITGYTDANQYQSAGITTYGFAPVKISSDFPYTKLIHGTDERIPVEGFRWGLETTAELVMKWICNES